MESRLRFLYGTMGGCAGKLCARRGAADDHDASEAKPGASYDEIQYRLQSFDLLLFRGGDPVSDVIRVIEGEFLKPTSPLSAGGPDDYSHVGLVIRADVLDNPAVNSDDVYVWESTMSGVLGDGVLNVDGAAFLGVQLRSLRAVVDAYDAPADTRVAFAPLRAEIREALFSDGPEDAPGARAVEIRTRFTEIFRQLNGRPYDANLISLAGAAAPALRPLHPAAADFLGSEDWLFCSELVATVYCALGVFPVGVCPQNVLPMDLLGFDSDEVADGGVPIVVDAPVPFVRSGAGPAPPAGIEAAVEAVAEAAIEAVGGEAAGEIVAGASAAIADAAAGGAGPVADAVAGAVAVAAASAIAGAAVNALPDAATDPIVALGAVLGEVAAASLSRGVEDETDDAAVGCRTGSPALGLADDRTAADLTDADADTDGAEPTPLAAAPQLSAVHCTDFGGASGSGGSGRAQLVTGIAPRAAAPKTGAYPPPPMPSGRPPPMSFAAVSAAKGHSVSVVVRAPTPANGDAEPSPDDHQWF